MPFVKPREYKGGPHLTWPGKSVPSLSCFGSHPACIVIQIFFCIISLLVNMHVACMYTLHVMAPLFCHRFHQFYGCLPAIKLPSTLVTWGPSEAVTMKQSLLSFREYGIKRPSTVRGFVALVRLSSLLCIRFAHPSLGPYAMLQDFSFLLGCVNVHCTDDRSVSNSTLTNWLVLPEYWQ